MSEKKWVQKIGMKKGALHKEMHVPESKKIPKKKLEAAAKKGGVLGKRANLAITLSHIRKGKKS